MCLLLLYVENRVMYAHRVWRHVTLWFLTCPVYGCTCSSVGGSTCGSNGGGNGTSGDIGEGCGNGGGVCFRFYVLFSPFSS